jgi:NADH-quinone oxidoreductase subunit A
MSEIPGLSAHLFAVLLTLLACTGFGLALQAAGPVRREASWPQRRPVLGGSEPSSHAWQRFHVRYYSMTLLFVAFEMEMMFMYPWAVVFVQEGLTAMVEMGMFLAILSVGILYGWREGVFRWQ